MPYISKERRDSLYAWVEPLCPLNAGELNYIITKICDEYILSNSPSPPSELSYRILNEVIGVLECAKQELYRKVVSPKEDRACEKHGEVYECLPK